MDITGIGSIADAASHLADKFFPDKTQAQKDAAALEMQKVMNDYGLATAQTDINKIEAASTNWFVAGWRPAIGWVCSLGLLYQFVLMPILNGVITAVVLALGHAAVPAVFVQLDGNTLLACISGLTGLATLRTVEKHQGVEASR